MSKISLKSPRGQWVNQLIFCILPQMSVFSFRSSADNAWRQQHHPGRLPITAKCGGKGLQTLLWGKWHCPLSTSKSSCQELHQPRLWFITGGYLVKRWFIPAAARARGQSNDLNRGILASNLFNYHNEVINAPPIPSISRCIHIVYRHKNVWEYQWSNFIYNCMSTLLHYVHCKDALLDCSAPGGERCESLTWVDEILIRNSHDKDKTVGFCDKMIFWQWQWWLLWNFSLPSTSKLWKTLMHMDWF